VWEIIKRDVVSVASIMQTIRGSSKNNPTLNRKVEYVKVTNSIICKNIIILIYMLTILLVDYQALSES